MNSTYNTCKYQEGNTCPLLFPRGEYGKELLLTEEDVQEQLKMDEERHKLDIAACNQCRKRFEEKNKHKLEDIISETDTKNLEFEKYQEKAIKDICLSTAAPKCVLEGYVGGIDMNLKGYATEANYGNKEVKYNG